MRQSLRKNRGWCHIHCDCCHQKKTQTQPRLRCSHQMWHLCSASRSHGDNTSVSQESRWEMPWEGHQQQCLAKGKLRWQGHKGRVHFQDQNGCCWVLRSRRRQWQGWRQLWLCFPWGPGLVLTAQAQGCRCPPSQRPAWSWEASPSKRLSGVSCDRHGADQKTLGSYWPAFRLQGQDQGFTKSLPGAILIPAAHRESYEFPCLAGESAGISTEEPWFWRRKRFPAASWHNVPFAEGNVLLLQTAPDF